MITVGGASLIMYYSGRSFTDNVITVGGASLPVNMWEEELICPNTKYITEFVLIAMDNSK